MVVPVHRASVCLCAVPVPCPFCFYRLLNRSPLSGNGILEASFLHPSSHKPRSGSWTHRTISKRSAYDGYTLVLPRGPRTSVPILSSGLPASCVLVSCQPSFQVARVEKLPRAWYRQYCWRPFSQSGWPVPSVCTINSDYEITLSMLTRHSARL